MSLKTKIFAIHDLKSETFNPPYTVPHTGLAVRAFGDLVNDDTTIVGKHPQDFRLFYIGDYDHKTAELTPKIPVQLITEGINLINKNKLQLANNDQEDQANAQA